MDDVASFVRSDGEKTGSWQFQVVGGLFAFLHGNPLVKRCASTACELKVMHPYGYSIYGDRSASVCSSINDDCGLRDGIDGDFSSDGSELGMNNAAERVRYCVLIGIEVAFVLVEAEDSVHAVNAEMVVLDFDLTRGQKCVAFFKSHTVYSRG